MKKIDASLLLAAAFLAGCLGGNECNAQQTEMGPTDLDGLYQSQVETSNSVPKRRVARQKAPAERTSGAESKLTDWEREAVSRKLDDDRLQRKLKICRDCDAPR